MAVAENKILLRLGEKEKKSSPSSVEKSNEKNISSLQWKYSDICKWSWSVIMLSVLTPDECRVTKRFVSQQTWFTQPPGIIANRKCGVLEADWRNSWVIGWTFCWLHSTWANWNVPLAVELLCHWAAPPAVRLTLGVCHWLGYMLVTCCGATTELLSKAGSATESLWLCSLPFF